MKFQFAIFFIIFSSVSSLPMDSTTASPRNSIPPLTRQNANEIMKHQFSSENGYFKKYRGAREICIREALNITEYYSAHITATLSFFFRTTDLDKLRMRAAHNLIVDRLCKLSVVSFENAKKSRFELTQDEILCIKKFLAKVRPQSEVLKNFSATDAESLNCNGEDPNEKLQNFNKLQITKCKAEDFLDDSEVEADAAENMLMMRMDEFSDAKKKEIYEKMIENLKEFTNYQIECVMSAFA